MPIGSGAQDSDRAYYDVTPHHYEPAAHQHMLAYAATIARYLDAVVPDLREHVKERPDFEILELGAGTCLATLTIRKLFPQARPTCLDISMLRMRTLIEGSAALVGTHHHGIELIEADFSNDLPLDDARFDVVVFDASLHHSRSIWKTLRECRRVLRPAGAVAALREQFLAPLTYHHALNRLLRSHEVRHGVSDNAYLKEQYAYYFRANGFAPTFHPVVPSARRRR
jgi:ubiquinone/menaquinone biosynthesis C-methylase UbiE